MATPTAAESKVVDAQYAKVSRSSAAANTSDSVQNVTQILDVRADTTTVDLNHRIAEYVGLCPPTATDYPGATMGSIYKELVCDSASSTSAPISYREWVKVQGGWALRSDLIIADVKITSTQLKAMETTAITLVAAPGTGLIAVPEGPIMFQEDLTAGTVGYSSIAAGDDIHIGYDGATAGVSLIGTLETTGFLDQIVKKSAVANPRASFVPVSNTAIKAKLEGAITTGTFALKVRVSYRVYDEDGWNTAA